jgi:hypothetical protein
MHPGLRRLNYVLMNSSSMIALDSRIRDWARRKAIERQEKGATRIE